MGQYVATEVVKLMINYNVKVNGSDILILGITFKENCPDVRNTKIVDVVSNLKQYQTNIDIFDPLANPDEVLHEYKLVSSQILPHKKYDAIILGVAHNEFKNIDFEQLKKPNAVIYDVKGILGNIANGRL